MIYITIDGIETYVKPFTRPDVVVWPKEPLPLYIITQYTNNVVEYDWRPLKAPTSSYCIECVCLSQKVIPSVPEPFIWTGLVIGITLGIVISIIHAYKVGKL